VIDLDPKPLSRLEKWRALDRVIVESFRTYLQEQEREGRQVRWKCCD
jgi:hypothetical protein